MTQANRPGSPGRDAFRRVMEISPEAVERRWAELKKKYLRGDDKDVEEREKTD